MADAGTRCQDPRTHAALRSPRGRSRSVANPTPIIFWKELRMIPTSDIRARQQQLSHKLQYTDELSAGEQAKRALGDAGKHLKRGGVNSARLVRYLTGQAASLDWKKGPSQERRQARQALDQPMPATHGAFLQQEQHELQVQQLANSKLEKKLKNAYDQLHKRLAKAQKHPHQAKLEQYTALIDSALNGLLERGAINAQQAELLRTRELALHASVHHGLYSAVAVDEQLTGSLQADLALLSAVQASIAEAYLESPLAQAKAATPKKRVADSDSGSVEQGQLISRALDTLQAIGLIDEPQQAKIQAFEESLPSGQQRLAFYPKLMGGDFHAGVDLMQRVEATLRAERDKPKN